MTNQHYVFAKHENSDSHFARAGSMTGLVGVLRIGG